MRMTPEVQTPPVSIARRWATGCLLAVVTILVASCSGVRSTRVTKSYDSNQGFKPESFRMTKPRVGESPVMRYYLPEPYLQVYAYEVRLLGRETLRIGFRSVAVPDLKQQFLVDHTYGMFFEDRLQVTTSPEGLLEYVGYRRVPKQVDAAATAARMALSFAAPLPGPLKGEEGLPEFSRLVLRTNVSVVALLSSTGTDITIRERTFRLSAQLLSMSERMPEQLSKRLVGSSDTDRTNQITLLSAAGSSRNAVKGLVHRPLMPLQVSLVEVGATPKGTAVEVLSSLPVPYPMELTTIDGKGSPILSLEGKVGNVALLSRNEAPIQLTDVVYCANPWETDTFFVPGAIFARQSFEIQLAGGSLYDARISRNSDVMGLVGGVSEFAGGLIRVPAQLFTFTVVHEDRTAEGGASGGGGDKAPRRYTGAEDKVPRRYIHIYDKE